LTELKTFNDLVNETQIEQLPIDWKESRIRGMNILRKEAIQWIKELNNPTWINTNGKGLQQELAFADSIEAEMCLRAFFNITTEELK
jgi:hypothetical protein